MPTVSVINYKGGVGKTSLTANLGAELAFRGCKVLLLDLDAQASLTFSFIKPDYWKESLSKATTIKAWFDSLQDPNPMPLDRLIFTPSACAGRLTGRGQLDLIASHLGLINVDLELATQLGGSNMRQAKQRYLRVHRRLLDGLVDIESDYDIVLIDCPPNFNIVTKNAIVASSHILTPAKPDYLSTLGIDYLVRSINELVTDYNDYAEMDDESGTGPISPELVGVVFTMINEYGGRPISALREFIATTKKIEYSIGSQSGKIPVFTSYIKENKTLFAAAPRAGIPVVLNAYDSQSHRSVVDSIENVVTEFMPKVGL